jgi:hypothetical protein
MPGVFLPVLANAIVAPNNCGYLQIQYGIVGFLITEADWLAHA